MTELGQMKIARREAYNIESMSAHGAEGRELIYIGYEWNGAGDTVYEYYIDNKGDYWYRTRYATPKGLVSLEEKVFGRKLPQRGWRGDGRKIRRG